MIRTLNQTEQFVILNTNYIGNLAYLYQGRPFVAPITYFYNQEQNTVICYSALGHKISALRKNNAVSLCVSDIVSVNDWKSVLVHGTYKEESGSTAKALLHQFSLVIKDLILKKEMRDLDFISQFSSKINMNNLPIVFTLSIEEITGRMRKHQIASV